jgi:hypothetical protein
MKFVTLADHQDRRQSSVDTRALEIATTSLVKIEGHEKVCTERYAQIQNNFEEVRSDIRLSVNGIQADIKTTVKEESSRWFKIGILVVTVMLGLVSGLVGVILRLVLKSPMGPLTGG